MTAAKYVFATYFKALSERHESGVLTLLAARTKDETDPLVGYNVWPRYGFDAPLTTTDLDCIKLLQGGVNDVSGLAELGVDSALSKPALEWLSDQKNPRFSTIFGFVKGDVDAKVKNVVKAAWAIKGDSVELYFDANEQEQMATLQRAIDDRKLSSKCPLKDF